MRIETHDEPFRHHLIDDCLPQELFADVVAFFETNVKWDKYTHRNQRFGTDLACLPKVYDCMKNLEHKLKQVCVNELEEREKGLSTRKWNVLEAKLCMDRPGYHIPLHCDILSKIVTIVLYVNSEGSGTSLFDSNKQNEMETQKIPNRALVFVPQKNRTWHAVHACVDTRKSIQFMFGY